MNKKGDYLGNKLTPGKLKKRFGPFDKEGKNKNNGFARKMGKTTLFDKKGNKLENNFKKLKKENQ